jgi:hypothetical protein
MARLPELPAHAPIAARAALARLEEIEDAEGRRLYDGALNTALQPLRTLQPLPVECGRCYRGVAYYGLEPGAAIVAACQRRAALHRRSIGGAAALSRQDPHPMGSAKAGWIEHAETTASSVRLVDRYTPGHPVRLKLICPRCGKPCVLTNTRRLQQFLTAIGSGSSRIVL